MQSCSAAALLRALESHRCDLDVPRRSTKRLARELAPEGVRVNAVSPGPIDTDMHRPGRLEEAIKRFPFGRAGTPEEVAEAVMFLVSEKSAFTSGAILNVSGAA